MRSPSRNRANLQYASAGIGSFQHLGGELFKLMAGVDIVHVPYQGGGPAMIDVIGGHTKIVFSSLIQTTPHVKSGQLKALATGGAKRNPVLPDVPTIAEAGVPGYEANNWWGMLAPAGTPPAIVEKLNKAISAALDAPELHEAIRDGRGVDCENDAGRIRDIYRIGNGQVGPRRQGRAHHGPIGLTSPARQLPLRSCASAKNRSCQDVGMCLRRPTLCMNSTCFIKLAGAVV